MLDENVNINRLMLMGYSKEGAEKFMEMVRDSGILYMVNNEQEGLDTILSFIRAGWLKDKITDQL